MKAALEECAPFPWERRRLDIRDPSMNSPGRTSRADRRGLGPMRKPRCMLVVLLGVGFGDVGQPLTVPWPAETAPSGCCAMSLQATRLGQLAISALSDGAPW